MKDMARHEFKAFVGGDEFLVEDHANYVTIRNAYTGNRILDVHKDTAAELVAILEYMCLTLKNNDLSIEEAERMELNGRDVSAVLLKCKEAFMEKDYLEPFTDDEKKTLYALISAYNVVIYSALIDAETEKLDKMAEAGQ